MIVEVNSARRRERIVKEIGKRLGSAAKLIETNVTDITKELASRARRDGAEDVEAPAPEAERTPELEAVEAEFLGKHWDAWIDTRVPALGRLEALLSHYARSPERSRSGVVTDVAELRRRLGLG